MTKLRCLMRWCTKENTISQNTTKNRNSVCLEIIDHLVTDQEAISRTDLSMDWETIFKEGQDLGTQDRERDRNEIMDEIVDSIKIIHITEQQWTGLWIGLGIITIRDRIRQPWPIKHQISTRRPIIYLSY